MGPLIIFVVIVVAMALIIFGWAMVLRIQRERKISEFKVNYMRLAGEEQAAYQRYIHAERALQDVEMDMHKSKELIAELRIRLKHRRTELRELIEKMRLVKAKINLLTGSAKNLDLEVDRTKLTSEIKSRLMFNNDDKKRILNEVKKIQEKLGDLPFLAKESAELGTTWENLRQALEQIENEFRTLDQFAFKKFSDQFIKTRTAENRLDPERELVNMILLLNNKRGLLYVRKKEMAKDPTTESQQLVKKFEDDIKRLEVQLGHKAKNLAIAPKRLNELKSLFLKA